MTIRSGREGAGAVDRLAAVAHRLRFIAVGAQKVAEQLQIEFVVLDNQDFLSHRRTCRRCGRRHKPDDPEALALAALGWTLSDEARAQRLLALTGLDSGRPCASGSASPACSPRSLRFLEAHEPDLLACAEALGVVAGGLVEARRRLEA